MAKSVYKDRAYILSITVNESGNPAGEVKLQPNLLIAKKSSIPVGEITQPKKEQVYKGGTLTKKYKLGNNQQSQPILLQTDETGAIVTIDTEYGKDDEQKNKSKSKQKDSIAWGIGEAVHIYNKEEQFFLPPLSAASYIYAVTNPDEQSWAQAMAELFNTMEGGFDGKAVTLKAIEVPVKKQGDAKIWMREPDKEKLKARDINENEYNKWYQSYKNKTIRGYFIPFYRVIIVNFSNEAFFDVQVELLDKHGKDIYLVETVRRIKTDSNNLFAAVFICGSEFKEDFYCIKVKLDQDPAIKYIKESLHSDILNEENSYTLKEKIRFSIKKPFGEFDLINGDPFSLEEVLVKQFPHIYSNYIMTAMDMGDSPARKAQDANHGKQGLDAVLHAYNVVKGGSDFALGILGSGSAKSYGMQLFSNLENVVEEPFFKDSIKLGLGGIELYDKVKSAQKALNSFAHPPADLPRIRDFVSKNWWQHNPDWDYSKTITGFVKIPERYVMPFIRGAGIVGAAMSTVSLYQDVKGLQATGKSMDDAKQGMADLVMEYDAKIRVPIEETQNQAKIEAYKEKLQQFITQGNAKQFQAVDGAYYLNVTYRFDEHSTAFDGSINDLVNLLSLLPELYISLEGHASPEGGIQYNKNLSLHRALFVKQKVLQEDASIDSTRINVVAMGESEPLKENGKINYKLSRRVVAVLPMNPVTMVYPPSREGIDILEKVRSKAVSQEAEIDDKIIAAAESAFDTVAGVLSFVPGVNLYAIAALAVKEAGKQLVSCTEHVQSIFSDRAVQMVKGMFANQQEMDYVNINQLLAATAGASDSNDSSNKGNSNKDSSSENNSTKTSDGLSPEQLELHTQFRLRAMSLNGLIGLMFRASLYASSEGVSYEEAIKKYYIEEYIKTYVVNDGWYSDFNCFVPAGLDEIWCYRIKAAEIAQKITIGRIDKETVIKHLTEQDFEEPSQDLSLAKLLSETGENLYAADQALSPIETYGMLSPLVKGIKSTYYIHSARYLSARYNARIGDAVKASFQKYFPIHYINSKNIKALLTKFKTDFSWLDDDIYQFTYLYTRPRGITEKGYGWAPMAGIRDISPYDQIRIIVILKEEFAQKLKESEEQGELPVIPAEVQCIRCDGWNIVGPKQSTWVRQLSKSDLLDEEIRHSIVGKLLDKKLLYGFVHYPSYQYGANLIYGTKPMASKKWWSAFRRFAGDFIGSWEMEYYYEVVLGNNEDTKRPIFISGFEPPRHRTLLLLPTFTNSVFTLTVDPDREHYVKDSQGNMITVKDESNLLDPGFLAICEEGVKYPELFEDHKLHLLVKMPNGDIVYPDRKYISSLSNSAYQWFQPVPHPHAEKHLLVTNYDWNSPIEIIALVVCDSIDTSEYEKQRINWSNIPGLVSLLEARVGEDGPDYQVKFEYLGEILGDKRNQTINWKMFENVTLSQTGQYLKKLLDNRVLMQAVTQMDIDQSGIIKTEIMMELLGNYSRKVYAARIVPQYQNFTGKKVNALRPFGISDQVDLDNSVMEAKHRNLWKLGIKITTSGDSGVSDEEVDMNIAFKLPDYLYGMNDRPWTAFKDIAKTRKEVAERQRIASESTTGAKMLEPESLGVKYYKMSDQKRREAIKKWLTEDSKNLHIYKSQL